MSTGRRRLLLSVSPRVLSDALSHVLAVADIDDVVIAPPGATSDGHFDGAIVTGASSVDADVVIQLPGESGGSGLLRTVTGDRVVDLRDLASLVDALDEHVGGPDRRSERLGGHSP